MGITNNKARSYENVDAQLWGGELSYSVAFHRSLLLMGGVSYVRGIQSAGRLTTVSSGNMAETPPPKSRLSLRYGNSLFFSEVNMLASARQAKIATYLLEQPTAGYAIFGLKGGVHHKRLKISAGIENLTNRYYYQHLSFQRDPDRLGVRIPEPGRTLFANIAVNLE